MGQNIWEGISYFLYPREARRPRARSNFLPFARTKGLTWELGVPAAPKWRLAVLAVLRPWSKTVLAPVGALRASWSKVITSPPAFKMRSRAFSVTCKAATCKAKIWILSPNSSSEVSCLSRFRISLGFSACSFLYKGVQSARLHVLIITKNQEIEKFGLKNHYHSEYEWAALSFQKWALNWVKKL